MFHLGCHLWSPLEPQVGHRNSCGALLMSAEAGVLLATKRLSRLRRDKIFAVVPDLGSVGVVGVSKTRSLLQILEPAIRPSCRAEVDPYWSLISDFSFPEYGPAAFSHGERSSLAYQPFRPLQKIPTRYPACSLASASDSGFLLERNARIPESIAMNVVAAL